MPVQEYTLPYFTTTTTTTTTNNNNSNSNNKNPNTYRIIIILLLVVGNHFIKIFRLGGISVSPTVEQRSERTWIISSRAGENGGFMQD
jgi:hypothetical protein